MFIDFHSAKSVGPRLLVGSIKWDDGDADPKHWTINCTARRPGYDGLFSVEADGVVTSHRPTKRGLDKDWIKHIEVVRHVEFPLTAIDSPPLLRKVIDALVAFRGGDETDLRGLAEQLAST